MLRKSIISGVGHFVPDHVVTNADLSKRMETTNEWIIERTGIQERRHVIPGSEDTSATMGTKAARKAIAQAGLVPDDIDFIIFATLSPDYYFPGPGVQVQELLGLKKEIGALDVRNQCSGFVYGLSVADQFIKTGMYNHILVIGAELHSGGLDFTTRGRNVSVIFGDGAGAVVLSATTDADRGILSTHLYSEGRHAKELALLSPSTRSWIPGILAQKDLENPDYYPYMNGNFVFKHAVVRFSEAIQVALQTNGVKTEDLKLLIPHQANLRISQFIQQSMKLRDDQVYNNIMRYGNTTAASIPIALSEAYAEGRIEKGDLVLFAAFGSGFTWASALMRW
jgi:3-oxoacyl-[acyl-carrier-protein] synthase-3